jgi:hypothetical protein
VNVLEQITLAWQCLLHTGRQLPRRALWTPWLVLGSVQLLVLVALWWFAHPWLSWLVAPRLQAMVGPDVLHYPNLFRVLPDVFARASLFIGGTVGVVMLGAATTLFATRFAEGAVRPGAALARAGGRAPALILANLPFYLIVVGLSVGVESWLAHRGSSGIIQKIVRLGTFGIALLVQAWFLYVNALVMVEGRSAFSALAVLPRAAGRGMVAALMLIGLTFLPMVPLQQLARASGRLVDQGMPETVGWLVVAEIAVAWLSAFLLTGGATLFFQTAIAERHGELAS